MLVDGNKFRAAREKSKISPMKLAIAGGYSSETRVYQIELKKDAGAEVPDIRLLPMLKAMGVTMADVQIEA
jgi:hypothetical protein